MPKKRNSAKPAPAVVVKGTPPVVSADIEDNVDDETRSQTLTINSIEESVVNSDDEQSVAVTEDAEAAVERLEEQFKEHIENATNKNTNVRLEALKSMCSIAKKHFMQNLVSDWKVTILDVIEKNLKRTGSAEGILAVQLGTLTFLQIGDEVCDVSGKLLFDIRSNVLDSALSLKLRTECSIALVLFNFFTQPETEDLLSSLSILNDCWTGIKPGCNADVGPLFCSALSAWALLLTLLPNRMLASMMDGAVSKVAVYLKSAQVDMRIASAETLALLYEIGYAVNDEFRPSVHQNVLENLESLAVDSLKRHAKRDRRVQRASLREVVASVKEQDSPEVSVKFGNEVLILRSWKDRLAYNTMCASLSSGMNEQLKNNTLLREYFDLGPPLLDAAVRRMGKFERQAIANALSKARTEQRGKQRDKRVANYS